MNNLADLLAQLDSDSKTKGTQFEHLTKWFLENDRRFRHLTQVWLWDDWPGRWGIDAGIDLIAEDNKGRMWAIQSKAYKATYSIKKRDVDTFLSESNRVVISHRLLIATTDRIGETGERAINNQEKPVTFFGLTKLEKSQVNWPASISDLQAPPLLPKEPRDYQIEAINAVVNGFTQTDRGQMIMACGTGKTLTALFVMEKLSADRTLVLAPSLSLLSQTLTEWTANATTAFEHLPVCSDETVVDSIVVSANELGDVTTNPVEIADFLRESGPRVVFATYQSSPEIAKAFELGGVAPFDLVVADEAHRTTGPSTSAFTTVLDNEKIVAKRRLFMTATPRRFTGRMIREAAAFDPEVASMDDETKYGPVFHRLAFAEAIERGLLTDYQVVVIGVDDVECRALADNARWVQSDGIGNTDGRTLAAQIGLAKAMSRHDLRRAISFHSRVEGARRFSRRLPEVISWMPDDERPTGEVWASYVSGEMTAKQRNVRLHELGTIDVDHRGLLSNARCLTEGVDVPTLDGVVFVDPKRSEVDIVQAVGRAIRLAPDKTIGTIVIPVFMDSNEDHEVILDDSPFKIIWDVVRALRMHDEELAEQLDSLRLGLGHRGAGQPRLPEKIHLDLPAHISADFARAFTTRLVDSVTAPWLEWFGVLEQFVEDNDHACVPVDYDVDGYKLGRWCVNQRARAERLSDDRWSCLDALPGWSWNVNDEKWEEGFRFLLQYIEVNKHASVSAQEIFEGYPLGRWCAIQRRDGKSRKLLPERKARLDAIDEWVWSLEEARWEKGFRYAQEFIATHDDPHIPQSYVTEDGFRLGAWLNFQRTRNNQGKLEPERVKRLTQLFGGWATKPSPATTTSRQARSDDWVSPSKAKWEKGYRYLQEFGAEHGHVRVPLKYEVDGFKLRDWLTNNRAKFDKLSPERQARLKALPGWDDYSHDAKWEVGYGHALDYVKVHGDAAIARSCMINGYPIGQWADVQRIARRKGKLSQDRINRLDALKEKGWDWNPPTFGGDKKFDKLHSLHNERWEVGFGHAHEFIKTHGHALIPTAYVTKDGFALGRWTNRQRMAYKANKMPADRVKRLNNLGWVWDTRN